MLPNSKILYAFLKEYLNEKEPEWGKGLNWFFSGFFASRREICSKLRTRFEQAEKLGKDLEHTIKQMESFTEQFEALKTVEKKNEKTQNDSIEKSSEEDISSKLKELELLKQEQIEEIINTWIDICHNLGNQAREAQKHQTLPYLLSILPDYPRKKIMEWIGDQNSYFGKTLHCIRTLLYNQLATDRVLSKKFHEKIDLLKKENTELANRILTLETKSIDITELNEQCNKQLLMLSDLCDVKSILAAKKARDKGKQKILEVEDDPVNNATQRDKDEFPDLEINTNFPLCYQIHFYFIFYKRSFEPHTKQLFPKFIKSAIHDVSEIIKQEDINLDNILQKEDSDDDSKEKDVILFDENKDKKKHEQLRSSGSTTSGNIVHVNMHQEKQRKIEENKNNNQTPSQQSTPQSPSSRKK